MNQYPAQPQKPGSRSSSAEPASSSSGQAASDPPGNEKLRRPLVSDVTKLRIGSHAGAPKASRKHSKYDPPGPDPRGVASHTGAPKANRKHAKFDPPRPDTRVLHQRRVHKKQAENMQNITRQGQILGFCIKAGAPKTNRKHANITRQSQILGALHQSRVHQKQTENIKKMARQGQILGVLHQTRMHQKQTENMQIIAH
mgnify:CR=1 FL=1